MPQTHNRIRNQEESQANSPSSDEEGWRSERRGGAEMLVRGTRLIALAPDSL